MKQINLLREEIKQLNQEIARKDSEFVESKYRANHNLFWLLFEHQAYVPAADWYVCLVYSRAEVVYALWDYEDCNVVDIDPLQSWCYTNWYFIGIDVFV